VLGLFNDSGFDRAYHNAHRFYAVRQAAQYGLPVVMANEDGISQLVNARGEVVAESSMGQQTALVSTLRLRWDDALNIYQSIGRKSELFLPLFLALVVFLDSWRDESKPTSN
jgi:apolipoprotein N-acyltransferase